MPALVFVALLTAPVSLSEMYVSGLSSAIVIALLLALCLVARFLLACPLRSFAAAQIRFFCFVFCSGRTRSGHNYCDTAR
jgi:hypothetical protein